jgi:hypothetical protein
MKKLLLLLTAILCFSVNYSFAQGADCNTADPFCTGVTYTFPASTTTTAPTGPNYGCLGSEPNPAFYYVQIATSGSLTIDISQADASGSGQDVDFICWGPFTSPAAGCASGLTGSAVDCSYSASATETCTIPTATARVLYPDAHQLFRCSGRYYLCFESIEYRHHELRNSLQHERSDRQSRSL